VHQIVVDSINRTDLDLRKDLYMNIVLSGGSTLTKGFGDRLLHEVQKLAVKDMRIKIFAPPERKYSTWIGGSILAGLSTFRKVCFTAVATNVLVMRVCSLTVLVPCRCG
jgi:centractin